VRLVVAVSTVLAIASCGGGRPQARGALPPEARHDAALELAALLPRGAHRCAVARPGAMSALQRSAYAQLSQGEEYAFLPDAPFVAVASAYRETARGIVRLTLVRTSADREAVRHYLEERSGVRLVWPDEEDDLPHAARYEARFIDDRTVAIGSTDFPESTRIGAEARCLSLASMHPGAVEVGSRRGRIGQLVDLGGLVPRRVDYRASVDAVRLSMVRVSIMRSSPEVSGMRPPSFDGPLFGALPLAVLAESRDERVEGRRVIETTRVAWQDMFLALEDERRIRVAIAADLRARGPQPASSVNVENLALVHEQRLLWEALVDVPGDRGVEARRELSRLLERAIESHPREAELRGQLFDLLARHVGDAESAAEVATQAITDGVGDTETFRQLRREALARSDAAELARALGAEGIVSRGQAQGAAEALAAAVLDGADYAFAEGAWIAGRALVRRAYGARARRVTSVAMDLSGLVESIGVLVDVADVGGALWVAVEGTRPPWGVARFSAEDAPRIALNVGRDVLVGAASTSGDPRLRALGDSLADSLSPGPIVVSFIVVPFGGDAARPVAWGRFEGVLASDVFTIQRIAGRAADVDWARVNRYLAGPLASSLGRVFPAPEVTIEAVTPAEAEALTSLSDLHPFVICRRRGLEATCHGAPEQPRAVHDFIIEFAGEVLEPAASALTGPRGR